MRLLVLISLLPFFLAAHDVWITPDARFHYGHRTPDAKEAKELPFDPANVTKSCRTATGETPGWGGKCDEQVAVLDGGVWAKTYDGTQKGSRADHPEALASWQSREVVCLMRNRLPQTPKGFALTPADDLAKARIGERMRFRATLNGAPLANIPVAYFGATRGVTDANGYINIRLKTPGLQQLTASHSAPSVNPGVDQTITSYTLNFEVAE